MFAFPLIPNESLKSADVCIVYETSTEMLFSFVGPILSFTNEAPIPSLLLFIGELTEKLLVSGAPSRPTHWVR
ncbi:hypothetical protein D3C80_1097150 [compost metagenome]